MSIRYRNALICRNEKLGDFFLRLSKFKEYFIKSFSDELNQKISNEIILQNITKEKFSYIDDKGDFNVKMLFIKSVSDEMHYYNNKHKLYFDKYFIEIDLFIIPYKSDIIVFYYEEKERFPDLKNILITGLSLENFEWHDGDKPSDVSSNDWKERKKAIYKLELDKKNVIQKCLCFNLISHDDYLSLFFNKEKKVSLGTEDCLSLIDNKIKNIEEEIIKK